MKSSLPVISIAGRRNVGKSTLFNAIIREKRAIVDSHSGLTRDVISYTVNYNSVSFVLSDTPGLDLPTGSELSQPILENARIHLDKSALVILLMENPAPDSFDYELAEILRKTGKPVIAAVNKIDNPRDMENISNFYNTGFSEIIPLSAVNRFNVNLLLDKAVELLPIKKTAVKEPDVKIAIIGRPNSGKSTLLNSFLGYQRAVVSEIPGTTRDSIDEEFMFHGKNVMIIDTAGLRKKSKVDTDVEYYSTRRTVDAIEKSDTVIHLIDAAEGLTEVDKKISDEIIKAMKPAVIAVNKWDAVEKDHKSFDNFKDQMLHRFYKTADYPVISISGKEKLRISKLLTTAIDLKELASMRIETPRLNRIFTNMQNSRRVPELGSLMKIYYATQTGTSPPAFKIFVNNPDNFRRDAVRHIEKLLTAELGIKGVPIKIVLEGKKERKRSDTKTKRVR